MNFEINPITPQGEAGHNPVCRVWQPRQPAVGVNLNTINSYVICLLIKIVQISLSLKQVQNYLMQDCFKLNFHENRLIVP